MPASFLLSHSALYSLYLSLSLLPLCCMSYCLYVCSAFCSPAASPELPPRYLLGQGQRPNTITHVCWYRMQNLSLTDYLRMNQVHTANRSPATTFLFLTLILADTFIQSDLQFRHDTSNQMSVNDSYCV